MSDGEKTEDEKNFINALNEDLRYSVSKFDGQTLAISGGALGISLTFIKDFVPFDKSIYPGLFLFAQLLFTVVITVGFVSHYWSMRGTIRSIEKADNRKYDEILSDNKRDNKLINRFNGFIATALPIGILLLVLYCFININHSKGSDGNDAGQKIIINKPLENGGSLKIEGELKGFQYSDTTENSTTIKIK
jgi:hypothetical protein